MATFVETGDCKILIDPGANLCSFRYGLPPHPLERWCLEKHKKRIALFAQSAHLIAITHYHFDHFIPDQVDLYRDKLLYMKNPNRRVNANQRNRAFEFLKTLRGIPKEICYMDGRSLELEKTRIVFSPPAPHGFGEDMGCVIQVAVRAGDEVFLHTSDVQGPCCDEPVSFILEQNPDYLYIDGPLTYLQGEKGEREPIDQTISRIKRILLETKVHTLIIDHHLLRDFHWEEKIAPLFAFTRQKGIVMKTGAEFRGEVNNLLEARRQQLYEGEYPEEGVWE